MGCGCGRTGPTRRDRDNEARMKLFKSRLNKKSKSTNITAANRFTSSVSAQRRSMCAVCPHSAQTKAEKKANLKRCHKANRFITHIVADMKFKCPIGRFKAVS